MKFYERHIKLMITCTDITGVDLDITGVGDDTPNYEDNHKIEPYHVDNNNKHGKTSSENDRYDDAPPTDDYPLM